MASLLNWPAGRIDRVCRTHGLRIVGVNGTLVHKTTMHLGTLEVLVDCDAAAAPGDLILVYLRRELENILGRPVMVKSLAGLTTEERRAALANCQYRLEQPA